MSSTKEPLPPQQSSSEGAGTKRKEPPPPFTPQEDWELISQGAEARLWKIPRHNDKDDNKKMEDNALIHNAASAPTFTMAKERFSKKYRHPILDERLTKQRCRMEGRILEKCRQRGLAVPRVWRVQAPILYMEFIDGDTVRNIWQLWMENSSSTTNDETTNAVAGTAVQSKVNQVGQVMGTMIGKLHHMGVIHGDLTTSNMMIRRESDDKDNDDDATTILLIDFGLAKNSDSEEDRAVDLYVLERALASTHPWLPESFMDDEILPAYAKEAPKAEKVLQRLEQVRLRGRKRECFG